MIGTGTAFLQDQKVPIITIICWTHQVCTAAPVGRERC